MADVADGWIVAGRVPRVADLPAGWHVTPRTSW
jgi:hypothetical protein